MVAITGGEALDYVLAHRCDLARAVLVLIRGWLSSGATRTAGRTASFESWDDLVRQTVCWVDREIAPGEFGDPLELMQKAQGADPEQECLFALLEALSDVFGSRWFTAKEVCRSAMQARANCLADACDQALAEALADIGGEKSLSSTRSTGRILQFREGRICFGLRLKSRSGRSGREYRVDAIPDTVTVHVPFRIVKRGGRKEMQMPDGVQPDRKADSTLVKALARAFRWKRMLGSGEFATIAELAECEGIAPSYMTRVLRLTLLAPDIVEAILDGNQGPEVTLARVLKTFPVEWVEQSETFWLIA